jgi:membrane protein required for beta-lactamase induction
VAALLVVLMPSTYLILRVVIGVSFGVPGTLTYFLIVERAHTG